MNTNPDSNTTPQSNPFPTHADRDTVILTAPQAPVHPVPSMEHDLNSRIERALAPLADLLYEALSKGRGKP